MPKQKESERVRQPGGGPATGAKQSLSTGSSAARVRAWLVGILITVVVLGSGVAIMQATRAQLALMPPMRAWNGPDPTSALRDTEIRLMNAAARAPSDAGAALALGRFYLEDARPFEALWVLRDAQRLDPKAIQPRLLMARALTMGQLTLPAVELLQAAVREFPNDPEAPQQLADLQLSLGRPGDAAATLQTAAGHQPLAGDALLLYGRVLEAAGRDDEALKQYQAFQQQQPKSEQVYLRLGRLMLRMGKIADARQAFMATQVLNAHSAEARYYLGLLALREGPSHGEEARQKFAEAVATDERFVAAHVQLGAYYQRQHDWTRATAVLQRAAALDPENAEALLQLSSVRRAVGDAAGASYYQGLYYDVKDARPKATARYAAMAAAGDDPRGPLLVSNGYVKMDQKQKAAEVARAGLKRHPDDPELTERLIALDLLNGNLKEAEPLCREWMRREPANVQPVWILGRAQLANHDYASALKSFQQAAHAEPKNAEYQYSLGTVFQEQASDTNWGYAARYFGQAVTLKPDDARFHLNLGIALENLHDFEGARRQFLRSMDLDANQSAPLNDLVQVARGLNQPDHVQFWGPLVRDVEQRLREELPDWKRVWDKPADADGYLPLAQFLMRTGELKKARNILEQAVALRPDLVSARRDLSMLQRTLDVL